MNKHKIGDIVVFKYAIMNDHLRRVVSIEKNNSIIVRRVTKEAIININIMGAADDYEPALRAHIIIYGES
jgi:hypothetical protein